MTSVFLLLGEMFNDEKLEIFKKEISKQMQTFTFTNVIERIKEINRLDEALAPIFYLDTNPCRSNKLYVRAFINVIQRIHLQPQAVYLLPVVTPELLKAIQEQWPNTDVYLFEYDKMKSSIKIN